MVTETQLDPAQQALVSIWEEHMRCEFETRSADATMRTMADGPHVNHVPVLTGGVGADEVREFYAAHFIPQMPPDTSITPVSRTVGDAQIVDELIFRFTHSIAMDWMLPGIAPTTGPSRFLWWRSSAFATARSRMSTSTGTRPRCSSSSACWMPHPFRSPVGKRPGRSSIRPQPNRTP